MAIYFYSRELLPVAILTEPDMIKFSKYYGYNAIVHERSTRINLTWTQFKEMIEAYRLNQNEITSMKIFNRDNTIAYMVVLFEGEGIKITSNDLLQKITPDLKINDKLDPIEIVFSREPIPDTRTQKIYSENTILESDTNISFRPMIVAGTIIAIIAIIWISTVIVLSSKNQQTSMTK